MNNQEAKFILSAYRSSGVDANDAVFVEALRQAQQDPTLRAWLAGQQAMDAALAAKFREIAPPSGLRDAILTGAKISGTHRPLWRQTQWLSLAAAAGVLIVTSVALWPKRVSAESGLLAEFALRDVADSDHTGHGGEVEAFRSMLGDPKLNLTRGVPMNFSALRGTGCRTVQVNGREVFEICFSRGGMWFHLYAVQTPLGSRESDHAEVKIQQQGKLACATWNDPSVGYRYALVGDGGVENLRRLL